MSGWKVEPGKQGSGAMEEAGQKCPAVQGEHVSFASLDWNVPASQLVQVDIEGEEEKLPGGQGICAGV